MDLKKRMDQSMPKAERPSMASLIQQAGLARLEARAGTYGFSFDPGTVRVDGYLRHRVTKKELAQPRRLVAACFWCDPCDRGDLMLCVVDL